MNYHIENIEVKQARNQSEYIALTLVNADDEWDEPFVVPIWNERQIARYKALLASPEVAGNIDRIPEEKRTFKYGFWEKCQLPQPMNRMWSQTMTIKYADGSTKTVQEGDIVCDKRGVPVLYTEFMVFTKKTVDNNTGEMTYANGWSFSERSSQMIARQFTLPQTVANVAPQTVVQAEGAPTVAQPTIQQPTSVPQGAPAQPVAQPVVAQPNVAQPGTAQPGAIPTV